LDGGFLLTDTTMPRQKKAVPVVFKRFTDLNADDDKAILGFARSWGAMGICAQHGLPHSHSLIPFGSSLGLKGCFPRRIEKDGTDFYIEPLSFWRRTIREFAALQRIGADVNSGGVGHRADWEALENMATHQGPKPWSRPSDARSLLGVHVQDWLYIGGIRPRFCWSEEHKRMVLRHAAPTGGFWPLFSWLTLRLSIEITGRNVVVCPYCSTEYFPERRPSPGQRHCCTTADCIKKRNTDYKREQREGKTNVKTRKR
jgi:hypothetical protein